MPGYFKEFDDGEDFGVWLLDQRLLRDEDLFDDDDPYEPDFIDLEDESVEWDDEKDDN